MFTQKEKDSCNEDPLSTKQKGSFKNKRGIFFAKNLISVSLLSIIVLEISMPHKVFAQERDQNAAKVLSEKKLVLAPAVYAFNDRYVPEEIALRNSQPKYAVKDAMTVLATAYSSTVDQTDDDPFVAASGKRVFDGMMAANFLKFGTKVRIPDHFGSKIFTVEDRMNKRFSERVDVWMNTRQEALNFGVRRVRIEVLEEIGK